MALPSLIEDREEAERVALLSKGTTRRSVRIPDETWDAALVIATKNGDNLSDIMREALEQYIEKDGRA